MFMEKMMMNRWFQGLPHFQTNPYVKIYEGLGQRVITAEGYLAERKTSDMSDRHLSV